MTNVERKRRIGGGTDKFLHHHLRAPGSPGLWGVHLGLTAVVVVILFCLEGSFGNLIFTWKVKAGEFQRWCGGGAHFTNASDLPLLKA